MNLRDLGHFVRASLQLPDPWRRPFERTTYSVINVAPSLKLRDGATLITASLIELKSGQAVVEAIAKVYLWEQRTLSTST